MGEAAETEIAPAPAPRKRLIIKLRFCGDKRKKDECCSTTDEYSSNVSSTLSITAEWRLKKDDDAADSCRGNKRRKMATEGKTELEHHNACSRTASKEKEEEEGVVCKKEEIVGRPRMDRYQKMQCWAILKRFMVGRDGWALKKPLDPKNLVGDNKKHEKVLSMKPIGLEDIESKLNRFMYSGPDDFAKDVRLLFSYGLMYPPRNEIHRISSKFSQSFETTWKALKKKWSLEEKKKRNMILKSRT
ncbi:hypothetical protein PIB30_050088 [Stylosanthes scabra]|uniref:Bromo domain-containing protein n=1 Tax=Stylosanthes scabra TaxID=79078 RepID=A0ABU6XJ46_9FABA|nr:hypothetical protein [Stylosanthes scabra]